MMMMVDLSPPLASSRYFFLSFCYARWGAEEEGKEKVSPFLSFPFLFFSFF